MKNIREGIWLMRTTWAISKTERYRFFTFDAHGGPDLTWKNILREKNIKNGESGGRQFYWIKYV